MSGLVPHITLAGLRAVVNAQANGLAVNITHIGLGDRGYRVSVNAAGQATQAALNRERERYEVQGSTDRGNLLDLEFIANSDLEYTVREFGFYLDDGTLFAVWSDPAMPLTVKSANADLVMALTLELSALPVDSVAIAPAAPPLGLISQGELAAVTRAIAIIHLEQARQAQAIQSIERRTA